MIEKVFLRIFKILKILPFFVHLFHYKFIHFYKYVFRNTQCSSTRVNDRTNNLSVLRCIIQFYYFIITLNLNQNKEKYFFRITIEFCLLQYTQKVTILIYRSFYKFICFYNIFLNIFSTIKFSKQQFVNSKLLTNDTYYLIKTK